MAAGTKFEALSEHLVEGVHQFHAAGHTVKWYLSNDLPSAALDAVKADHTEIAGGNGYTAGGIDTQNDTVRAAGNTKVTVVDAVVTASGGTVGPFKFVVAYNDTPSSPADPLIAWWEYPGANITLQIGETFTIDATGNELLNVG